MLRLDKYNPFLLGIVHYTAAFVVLTKTLALYFTEQGFTSLVLFYLTVGLFILAFSIFRKTIISKLPYSEGIINLVEALILFYTGLLYSTEGRVLIHYALYVAAFNYLAAGVISLIRTRSSL